MLVNRATLPFQPSQNPPPNPLFLPNHLFKSKTKTRSIERNRKGKTHLLNTAPQTLRTKTSGKPSKLCCSNDSKLFKRHLIAIVSSVLTPLFPFFPTPLLPLSPASLVSAVERKDGGIPTDLCRISCNWTDRGTEGVVRMTSFQDRPEVGEWRSPRFGGIVLCV
jgi:hypothetical protein